MPLGDPPPVPTSDGPSAVASWTRRSRPEGVMAIQNGRDHPALDTSPVPRSRATRMWPSIARTRDLVWRLVQTRAGPGHDSTPLPGDAATDPIRPDAADDIVLTLGRTELDRLGIALQDLLGPATTRPDTPARLEAALAAAVAHLGGTGRPSVSRRPPGLTTPEAWQVRLTGIEPAIGEAIRHAAKRATLVR